MRLTDEQVIQDNKRFANCNALAELKYCGWDIPHRKSITNDEIHFYAWLCRSAVGMLKEQKEPKQIVRKQCKKEHDDGSIDYFAEWYCPHCSSLILRGFDNPSIKFCYKCGKPIDWEGR